MKNLFNGNQGYDSLPGTTPPKSRVKVILPLSLLGLAALVLAITHHTGSTSILLEPSSVTSLEGSPSPPPSAHFDPTSRFILPSYDLTPAHSNFLPAVAGRFGKPLWSFFVNRGQALTGFGYVNKDEPVSEFQPANKAYQMIGTNFRTFVKREGKVYEPFKPREGEDACDAATDGGAAGSCPSSVTRTMYVGQGDLSIVEVASKLTTNVTYFTLPSEKFGALVRVTTITNTDDESAEFEVLDGLAKMEPAGGPLDGQLKNMGRTLEGWMDVYNGDPNPKDGETTMPFYRLSTVPGDTADVKIQVEGHYSFSFIDEDFTGEDSKSSVGSSTKAPLLPIMYDTNLVFGQDTTLTYPTKFTSTPLATLLTKKQSGAAKTSSAFAAFTRVLEPGESVTVVSFFGKAPIVTDVKGYVATVQKGGFTKGKLGEMRTIMEGLTSAVSTSTNSPLFNSHVTQMYLDNFLRGGVPVMLGGEKGEGRRDADEDKELKVYHTFSRIHGDLERDYNAFTIDSTYFSQGQGNYRDVAQNRRNDVMFNPRMGAFNVKQFLSFIQADAYEPLTVQAITMSMSDDVSGAKALAEYAVGSGMDFATNRAREALTGILKGGQLRPGQLFQLMEDQQIYLQESVTDDDFVNKFASMSKLNYMATYGEGFWADHWEYYLDLVESYLAVYPDREESLMYDMEQLPYFYSPATCQPRSKKYVATLSFGGKGEHVQQLGATTWDNDKTTKQNAFLSTPDTPWMSEDANWQHSKDSEVFKSAPVVKLFLLGVMKFATRDPYGMGVEYEGGKPGWNDAMNGLVGMLGSGMPETYELQLVLRFVLKVVSKFERDLIIPAELNVLLGSMSDALDVLEDSGFDDTFVFRTDMSRKVPEELFTYWDAVATARETYREDVKYSFSGKTATVDAGEVQEMLKRFILHVEMGMDRAMKIGSHGDGDDGSTGVAPSYFSYNVTKWTETGELNADGHPYVNAEGFEVGVFPLFLEGPTRMMKTLPQEGGLEENLKVYENVKNSGLYDKELNAYTVSSSLVGQSYDMGRMMAFSPGWLENQSVWTHMSYKFYLQLLRAGLSTQFFGELKGGSMLPFVDFKKYGRSLLECSSFIASSAFPDEDQHGRGFLARLSGSTAEFLSMWVLMFIGKHPFVVDELSGELQMTFEPALPEWAFDERGEVSYKLFSEIHVTYKKDGKGDLINARPHKFEVKMKGGEGSVEIEDSVLPEWIAQKARRLDIEKIVAYF